MNKSDRNKYFADYMRNRYRTRRAEVIKTLGGKCKNCGSEESLELDHKDRKKKNVNPDRMMSLSKKRFDAEVLLLQLLCRPCHTQKTIGDLGRVSARNIHGTISSYRYCKCSLCRAANAKSSREYKRLRNSTGRKPNS